jgi:hypothetical protein
VAGIVRGRVNPAEPIAVVVSAVAALLAASGIPSQLGLSADDTATLLCAVFAIAASVRGWLQARQSKSGGSGISDEQMQAIRDNFRDALRVASERAKQAKEPGQ